MMDQTTADPGIERTDSVRMFSNGRNPLNGHLGNSDPWPGQQQMANMNRVFTSTGMTGPLEIVDSSALPSQNLPAPGMLDPRFTHPVDYSQLGNFYQADSGTLPMRNY